MEQLTLNPRTDEDAGLVRRLRERDPQAMTELYDRYSRLTWLLIFRVVGNEAAAEDLVQESFLRVWNSIHIFNEEKGTLGRWVLSVARNRAIDYVRSWEGRMDRGAVEMKDWDQPATHPQFENEVLNLDVIQALRRAMAHLTPRQRNILNLAYVEGLTQSEMAAKLDRPLGTVKTWVRAALQTLRTEMMPYRRSEA